MRRTTTAALVSLALLIAACIWLLRSDHGAEPAAVGRASPIVAAPAQFALPLPEGESVTAPLIEGSPTAGSPAPQDAAEEASTKVAIVVVDQLDAPVPGATVDAVSNPYREDDAHAPPLATWRTDAAGRCTVQPPAEDTWISASKAGIGCSRCTELTSLQQLAAPAEVIVLRLVPPSRLRGIVIEPNDAPAAGATVNFWAFGGSQAGVPEDLVTGPDGRFDIEVDGDILLAMGAEFGSRIGQEFRYRTEPGGEKDVRLRLPGDWSVAGIVFDRHTVPVMGAKVTLWRNMPDQALPPELRPEVTQNSWYNETLTGADGRFYFAVRERLTYTVIARVGIELPTSAAVAAIDEHQDHAWLELRLPEPSFLAGDVVRADGTPAEGVTLTTSTGSTFSPHARLFVPQHSDLYGADSSAVSGPDGHFRIETLHPDAIYTLRIAGGAAGHAPALKGVHAGTADLHIQLLDGPRPTGSVVFDVVSARDGRPIADPEIHVLRHIDGFVVDAQLESELLPDGRRRFDGLSAGETYSGWIVATDYAAVDIPAWTIAAGEQERRVELPQSAHLEVQVSLPDGRPAAWAEVRLSSATPRVNGRGWYRHAADAQGHVSFGPFDPGPMLLHVLAAGADIQRDLVIGDGARETLRVVLSE